MIGFLQYIGALHLVRLAVLNTYKKGNSYKACSRVNEKETCEFYGLVKSLLL